MEVPDKVYIDPNYPYEPYGVEKVDDGEICYLRKDALLEWLENKIKISDGGFVNGLVCLAYKDIIEHLNGM